MPTEESKYAALDNFKYGEDLIDEAYEAQKAEREAREKAFIEADDALNKRLKSLLAKCQDARKEI